MKFAGVTRSYAALFGISLSMTCLVLSQASAAASEIDNLGNISGQQNVFKDLTSDLGSALGYKAITPAEPLGGLGFDIGFEVSSTNLETDALQQVTTGDAPSTLYVPKVHIHKGLPLGFDVGAFYTSVPTTNFGLVGGELRYALYKGSALTPAVSLRGSFSQLTGVNDLNLQTRGVELSISKGFAFITPYAGIGNVWIDSQTDVSGLDSENLSKRKYFLGVNMNLGLMNFAAETEQTGENATTSAKIGVRF